MGWIREGECPPERCKGHCCSHTGVFFSDPNHQVLDFLKLQQIRGASVKKLDDVYLLDLPQVCQYLTRDGLCALHPSMKPSKSLPSRPDYCNQWPTEPSQLINDPDCGFSFRWQEEELAIG